MWKSQYRGRPIKFRGVVPDSDKLDGGKIVYGSLVIYATGMYSHWIYTEGADRNCPVEPESVAQLVGYDRDGREVYEGDVLILSDTECKPPWNEYTAELKVHGCKHGASVTFEAHLSEDRLKEVRT